MDAEIKAQELPVLVPDNVIAYILNRACNKIRDTANIRNYNLLLAIPLKENYIIYLSIVFKGGLISESLRLDGSEISSELFQEIKEWARKATECDIAGREPTNAIVQALHRWNGKANIMIKNEEEVIIMTLDYIMNGQFLYFTNIKNLQ